MIVDITARECGIIKGLAWVYKHDNPNLHPQLKADIDTLIQKVSLVDHDV